MARSARFTWPRRLRALSPASQQLISCSASRCFAPRATLRAGNSQIFSEFVATFGLLAVIWGARDPLVGRAVRRRRLHHRLLLVHGLDLVRQSGRDAGARPSDTFSGIRPNDVPGFIVGTTAPGPWRRRGYSVAGVAAMPIDIR